MDQIRSDPQDTTPGGHRAEVPARDTDTEMVPPAVDVSAYLELSDTLDMSQRLAQAAERDAYERGRQDGHAAGYVAAVADFKAFQHGVVAELRQHLVTWDGLRERFANARPTDYPGGPRPRLYPGKVWLAGPTVHYRHRCAGACFAYEPGWYTPEDAAAILATLPGDYGAVAA